MGRVMRLPRVQAKGAVELEAGKGGQVQSLTRALSLLEALARSHDRLTLTELAQTVGLATSTAHRLLTTLQQARFARFDPLASVWQVGVQAFIVGNAFARTRDVTMIEADVEVIEIDELPQEQGDRFAARSGFDPRGLTSSYRWFRLTPRRIQAWREVDELAGRELMRDGVWVDT